MVFEIIIPIAMFDIFESDKIMSYVPDFLTNLIEFDKKDEDLVNANMRSQVQLLQHDSYNSLRVMGSVSVFFCFYLLKLMSLPILRLLA